MARAVILSLRPIKVMPDTFRAADAARPGSPFTADYRSTLMLLDRELNHLRARDVIAQIAAAEDDFKLDGDLRSTAKVTHPGVILSFTTRKHGALSYPCDAFAAHWGQGRAAWKDNLRAIALGLEALRRVERYGIAARGEQYAGWRELGSGIPMPSALSVEEAAAVLVRAEERDADPADVIGVENAIRWTFQNAAKIHHPDAGGDPEMFKRIVQARDVLLADAS